MQLLRMKDQPIFIIGVGVLLSLLLSAWVDWQQQVINPDGICYLQSAAAYPTLNLKAITQLCAQAQWPFYSVLIQNVVQLTHWSYMTAAFVLNGLFSGLIVAFFMLICAELGAARLTLWFALFTILFTHDLNSVRASIIRDHGYWAFYLLSVYAFIRYFKKPSWPSAVSWSVSLILATAFRIEGAIFLLLLPTLMLCQTNLSWREKGKEFFRLHSLSIAGVSIALLALLLHPEWASEKWGRVAELLQQISGAPQLALARFTEWRDALVQYVLPMEAKRDGQVILILTLITGYLYFVLQSFGWVMVGLVAYALRSVKLKPAAPLFAYLTVNFIITALFYAQRFFFSRRYLVAVTLVFLIWVPFALAQLWRTLPKRQLVYAVLALIVFSGAGPLLNRGVSKTYLRDAGNWLAANIPANANLFVNDYQVMYYSKHFANDIFARRLEYSDPKVIAGENWRKYDYLALRLNHEMKVNQNQPIKLPLPIQVFCNERGDRIAIYRTS